MKQPKNQIAAEKVSKQFLEEAIAIANTLELAAVIAELEAEIIEE